MASRWTSPAAKISRISSASSFTAPAGDSQWWPARKNVLAERIHPRPEIRGRQAKGIHLRPEFPEDGEDRPKHKPELTAHTASTRRGTRHPPPRRIGPADPPRVPGFGRLGNGSCRVWEFVWRYAPTARRIHQAASCAGVLPGGPRRRAIRRGQRLACSKWFPGISLAGGAPHGAQMHCDRIWRIRVSQKGCLFGTARRIDDA